MNNQELKKFLVVAKRATYANGMAKKVESLRPGSHDYHFKQGEFIYHDTYFGGKKFIGEEVVYKNNKPIWAMNSIRETGGSEDHKYLDKVLKNFFRS